MNATVPLQTTTYVVVRLHLHGESGRVKGDSHAIIHPTDNKGSPWQKKPASAGALNRTSKEKTAAVCGAMQCQCIVESISEEAAHQNRCLLTDTSGCQPLGCVFRCGFYILVLCHADYLSFIVVGRSAKHRCLITRE